MTRNSVPKDITDFLQANIAASGPFFPNEWGKSNAGGQIEKQSIIQDSAGGVAIMPDNYENPIFTLTVRGQASESTEQVWARAVAIHDFLIQSASVTINTTLYKYFTPFAPLQLMQRDDRGLPMVFAKYFTYRDVR